MASSTRKKQFTSITPLNSRLTTRMRLLYGASRLSIPVNIINGLIILIVFWQTANTPFLITWTLTLTLISLARMVAVFFVSRSENLLNVKQWLIIFMIGSASTGATWGALAFSVPMTGPTSLYFICAIIMISGMTSGATASSAAYLPAGLAFNIPALLALGTAFALEGTTISYIMCGITVIYGLGLTQVGLNAEKTTRELLRQKDIVQTQASNINSQGQLMQDVLNTLGSGIAVYNKDLKLTYWNQSLITLLKIPKDWPDNSKSIEDLIRLLALQGEYGEGNIEDFVKERMEPLKFGIGTTTHKYERERPDGKHIQIMGIPMHDGGFVTTYTDITEQTKQVQEIKYLADHDSLTGLANRSVFQRRLESAMAHAKRRGTLVSVYYLDLDFFKDVNDTLGHPTGDKLLQAVANRIVETVRDTDTVARLGGDEFAIIGTNHESLDDVAALAQRILAALSEPHIFPNATLNSPASIGATIFPYDDTGPIEIASHADVALYKAKQMGRNQFVLFDEAMNKELQDRTLVERDLIQAIDKREFVLYYQPQINLTTGAIIGAEALIRWHHPERGLLTPDKFLEVAEKTRLIGRMTEWVIQESAAFLGRMKTNGHDKFKLSLNLSADDFRNEDLKTIIWEALKIHSVPGGMLEVEVTESMVIPDIEAAIKTLKQLKEVGITIAIDDFGVGYSSMSYLRDFSPDVLKIDRSFIADCLERSENAKIVEGIINLGHSLGIKIVAEGIENEEQSLFLQKANCEMGQGYFFGRPTPENDFLKNYI